MANMTVNAIRRTGTATAPFRQLEVIQGEGKRAVRRVLSTPITKLGWAPAFRHGASAVPMEQYCFEVDGKVVERFADATAMVLKKHHVILDENVPLDELQAYVRKAVAIMRGEDTIRFHQDPLPADAAPAAVAPTEPELPLAA